MPGGAVHWCFTINNYEEDESLPDRDEVNYIVIGKEIGDGGTPHLQGYVAFKNRTNIAALKRINSRAHWEIKRGTVQQASDYCKKDGNYTEYGVLPAENTVAANKKRAQDYANAVSLAKQQRMYDVVPDILLRHGNVLKMIQKDHPAKLNDLDHLCGIWIYGPPGCGKSRTARWIFPGAYPKPLNKWWDGYCGEPYVVLDDFDLDHKVLGHHVKQWADHYPFTAEQKGTSVRIRPEVICITSNYTIEEIWTEPSMQQAILRRFDFHWMQ